MFNAPSPEEFIANVSTELERYGSIQTREAVEMGRRRGMSEEYVKDLLAYLEQKGVLKEKGEQYVLSKEAADQLAHETARLTQKPNIPPMKFSPPKPGPKPY